MEFFLKEVILVIFLHNLVIRFSDADSEYDYITCGSTMKLKNNKFDVRLHSHDVRYGSASGQQSVTGVSGADDHNSYWQIKNKTGAPCDRGLPIKCNDVVRLFHLTTKKNLHSHLFAAPLSGNSQEVSCFGEDGLGDEGDHWMVVCQGSSEYWRRSSGVKFRHLATSSYLQISGERYQRPIAGQYEVVATPAATDKALWTANEGIYISRNSPMMRSEGQKEKAKHDEL